MKDSVKNSIRLLLKLSLVAISLFISATAFTGGINLISDPTGFAVNVHLYLPLIPFAKDYFSLGIMLILFNGVSQFIAFFLLLTNNNYAGIIACISASVLVVWCAVQLFFIGWMFYSGFYFVLALIEIGLGIIYFFFLRKYVYSNNSADQ